MAPRGVGHGSLRWLVLFGLATAMGACRDIWGIGGLEGATTGGSSSGGAVAAVEACAPCSADGGLVYACLPGSSLSERCSGETPHCNPAAGTCTHLLVDDAEVTEAEFRRFEEALTNGVGRTPQEAPRCSEFGGGQVDATCTPICTPTGSERCDDHPKTCVSWCEAWAYCRTQGAYLCGSLAGAEAGEAGDEYREDRSQAPDAASDAWINACSAGGTKINYNSSECGEATASGVTFPVRDEHNTCEVLAPGGYSQFFGLWGNVREWVNDCNGQNECAARGASVSKDNWDKGCAVAEYMPRQAKYDDVGFRCCGRPASGGAGGESSGL
jgi:formylglycine-generating enzyme